MVIRDKDDRRKNSLLKRYHGAPSYIGDLASRHIYEGLSEKVVGFTLNDIEMINESMSNSHKEIWEAFKNLEKHGYVKHGDRPVDTNIFLVFKKDKEPDEPLEKKIYKILLGD